METTVFLQGNPMHIAGNLPEAGGESSFVCLDKQRPYRYKSS